MRELDAKSMIKTDFLLVNGDFVSNLPLEGVLQNHRERRTKDKNAIMTMILRKAEFEHRAKARGESGIFVIDDTTQRCIHYEEMRSSDSGTTLLPSDLRKHHPRLRIRADLIDCQVDICSPDVPALFTENFDYQHIRRHFVHGILTDYELYGKTIHTHIVSDGYAARVRSLQTYDAVSRDIVGRWAYPLVPDNNLGPDQNYTMARGNVYKEQNVALARSCTVRRNTILGRGVTIGEGTIVGNSIIGSGCIIGKNVVLDRAYIWDNAVVGDGCKIQNSIIASDVVMGEDCLVRGSIVSYGVKLPKGRDLHLSSKISSYSRKKALEEPPEEAISGSEYEDSESGSEDEQVHAEQEGLGISSNPMLFISTLTYAPRLPGIPSRHGRHRCFDNSRRRLRS